MITNGQIVSEIINDLRLLNIDEHISRRYILSKLRNKAKTLISQKLLDRTLQREYNLYKEIRCFELEKIDTIKCDIVEFRTCNTVMKSKKPLPESVYSRLGIAIKEVTNIDGSLDITFIDPKQYRRNKNRQVKDTTTAHYYVDGDNYLYIVNSEVEIVNLWILTLKPEDIEDVEGCDHKKTCQSPWEQEFVIPDKLLQTMYKDALLTELASVYKQIPVDENPNLNSNIK